MSDQYDAFGRKKDEAGLGDLGWGATGDANATTVKPAPPATPTATPTPTPLQTLAPPTGLGRPSRNPLIYIVQFLVVLGIGLGVFLAVDGSSSVNHSVQKSIDDFTKGFGGSAGGSSTKTATGSGTSTKDGKVPPQAKARDYFTAAGLRAGLRILAKEQPGRITNFSFRRDRIDVQVVRGGKTHVVDFPSDAEVPSDFSQSDATSSGTPTLSYEEINPTAAVRLMHAANARLNRSIADVDYFVVQKWTGQVQWGIYYKGGNPIAQGDSRGRYLRRIS